MINKKLKLMLTIFGIIVLSIFLGGCSNKKVLSKNKLNNEFNSNTEYVLQARGLISKQVEKNSKTKNITLTKSNVTKLLKIKKEAQISRILLEKSNISDYPTQLLKYNSEVLEYISLLEGEGTTNQAKKSFHRIVTSGEKILVKYQDAKLPKYFSIAIEADNASGYNPAKNKEVSVTKKSETFLIDKKGQLKKVTSRTKKTTKKSSVKVIKVNLITGILLSVISILIIVLVFLQPTKSQDTMNALTESGGTTIFSIPKEKGYQLFLTRSTEILVVVLALILVIYNWKG